MILFGPTDYLEQHVFFWKSCQKTSNRLTPNVWFISEQPIRDFFEFFLGNHIFSVHSTAWLGRVSRSFCKFWAKICVFRSNHVYSCLKWTKKTTFHFSIIKIAHVDAQIKVDFDPHAFFGFCAYFYLCLFLCFIKHYKGCMKSLTLTNIIFSKTVFSNAGGVITIMHNETHLKSILKNKFYYETYRYLWYFSPKNKIMIFFMKIRGGELFTAGNY